jgi:aminopeptidase N
MNRFTLLALSAFLSQICLAQFSERSADTSWKVVYRAAEPKTHEIIHTKLDVSFDFDKAWMLGKEWLTLKPWFYATDSISLDAKGMEIKEVSLLTGTSYKKLQFSYNGTVLSIKLPKSYRANEKFTLFFNYISKPNELKTEGSAAITDAKGLYFINPKGTDKNKPIQIWTQGETESNSAWMITIDKPNQKSTQEISMTVPKKMVTLSNGLLVAQKNNADGSRTDSWKMDLPHAPYLFFMGVGEFSVVKDNYKGKEVSYYVEKKYQENARGIFGKTPAMMDFFSKQLGVEYPWAKYAQIVGRDYVSGAMENTTATLHQESAYQNARELTEGNGWEETIAHELFHHWFGDLVTAESWSNLTVNESFANYSEYLWDEHAHGKDFADAHHAEDMQGYLMSGSDKKDLVRFHYSNREDMFDAVSYNKGGRILHMLRNLVGDEAFFKSLKLYLTTNKFKTGEAHQLRLAFEETTGLDLNWFWNQWYYGNGHPKLKMSYSFDSAKGNSIAIVEQAQKSTKIFSLPIAVDVYVNGQKTRFQKTLSNQIDTLIFPTQSPADWIDVDAERILLAERTDNKNESQFMAQAQFGKTYIHRKEVIDYCAKNNNKKLIDGLTDPFFKLRVYTLQKLTTSNFRNDDEVKKLVEKLAETDPYKKVRAAALNVLVKLNDSKYIPIFEKAINDSSYTVAGMAFKGLHTLQPESSYERAKKYASDAKGLLGDEIIKILIAQGKSSDFPLIATTFANAPLSQEKFGLADKFSDFIIKVDDPIQIKEGINLLVDMRNAIPEQFRKFVDASFEKHFKKIAKAKGTEIEAYINSVFKMN